MQVLVAGTLVAAVARVAVEAIRQRGETRREELRQNGRTARTVLTGEPPGATEFDAPEDPPEVAR